MPETPPKGIFPLFIRGSTLEKYGMKTGEGVNDVVDYKYIPKETLAEEIQKLGAMSDFGDAKEHVKNAPGDQILIVVDRTQKYGETYLLIYTDEAKEQIMKSIMEEQEALQDQIRAELEAEEAKRAAEQARLTVVYEDKPIIARPWVPAPAAGPTALDTEGEICVSSSNPIREVISVEINRPKRFMKQAYRFSDRNADSAGVAEFRAYKDPNFKTIREGDIGIQVAASTSEGGAQTTFFRLVNKSVQYESAGVGPDCDSAVNDNLLAFLEKATVRIEQALQQNESVDIFHDTFRLLGEEGQEGVQTENELRELRNFADANYSKSKALAAIDWMPKAQGMVAVSAVRNISFDQRIPILGQTHTSYVMLWDFRLLVKPLVLMQSHHEIFTFRFNRTDPNLVVGGCITGQVVLWEVSESINNSLRKNNRGSSSSSSANQHEEEEEQLLAPVSPKYISGVDFSHKKCVADLFWLPPTTQINYRGQLVAEEHLDGKCYQFITVAGDGLVMVWDIRYERIFNDELRHIARPKHIPTEKSANKDAALKPIWAPIFKAHLKRLEGVGELSLCKICETANPKSSVLNVGKASSIPGDSRSQFIIATEEGDIIFADLSARREVTSSANKEEEDDEEAEVSCVKWITRDHARPSVHLQESPFFPQIVLSISDWNFHIWKLGEDKPLFVSPLSNSYLTAGAWSTTRPAVLFIACADGQILVWDFTDSGFRPSIELKATHAKITSMEILSSFGNTGNTNAAGAGANNNSNANNAVANAGNAKHQLLAVGDDMGTLHIFEMPRNLIKPVHKEESIMLKFLEREHQRIDLLKTGEEGQTLVGADEYLKSHPPGTAQGGRPGTAAEDNYGASAPPTAAGTMRPGATGTTTALDVAPIDEAQVALNKEEEEFLKLESIFISELGLDSNQLPSFLAK